MLNNEIVVHVAGLTVRRDRSTVLRDVALEIAAGRITGLLGPSGAGKSTLIRALIGVQAGVSGTVEILGHRAGSRSLARQVSYMSQSAAIYDDLTIGQNVSYFASALGLGTQEIARAVDAVDLAKQRSRLVSSLSGGQRNRVALAIALLGEPKVVVLDEPTVGLDPLLRRDLWAVFRRVADSGAAVVVSSHVMDEAARCDDLVLLRDGEVLAHDSLPALYAETGTGTPEEVFLALVERNAAASAGFDGLERSGPPAPSRPGTGRHAEAEGGNSEGAGE